jgi:hypothetical protein
MLVPKLRARPKAALVILGRDYVSRTLKFCVQPALNLRPRLRPATCQLIE